MDKILEEVEVAAPTTAPPVTALYILKAIVPTKISTIAPNIISTVLVFFSADVTASCAASNCPFVPAIVKSLCANCD